MRGALRRKFPSELEAPSAIGPEVPREGLPGLHALIEAELPGSVMAPLLLGGRTLGVLVAVDAPEQPLVQQAREAAAALALGTSTPTSSTPRVGARRPARRRRSSRTCCRPDRADRGRDPGGQRAAGLCGGDWFDYIEDHDGAWIGVADSKGKGTTAAALGAVALGAFRAKRRVNAHLDANAWPSITPCRRSPPTGPSST